MDTDPTDPIPVVSPADAESATSSYRLRWVVAAVVLAAATMDLLDATIVNIAGPSIHRDWAGVPAPCSG